VSGDFESPSLLPTLSALARSMALGVSVQEILERLVSAVTDVVPVSGAGVTLLDSDLAPRFVAASDETALLGEKLQAELQEGPSLVAHRSRERCEIPDLASEPRFPRFRSAAAETGLRAVFAFPLCAEDTSLGAIGLYRRTSGVLAPEHVQTAQTLSDVVATFLINDRRRTQLEAFVEHLRTVSHRDPLTQLPNRILLMERLEHAFARGNRSAGVIAAIFVDLDGFKAINDRYGHAVGDQVLVAVARRIGAILRPADTLARLGGDEFVIVCEELDDPKTVQRLAARVTERLRAPFDIPGGVLQVGASLGSALSGPACQTPLQLLHDADEAMYEVKRARHGRAPRGSMAPDILRWPSRNQGMDVSWADGEAGAGTTEEWWIDGPTPHGGVVTSVVWAATDGALVVTEFGREALIMRRHEWIRVSRHRAGAESDEIETTVTDWDEQVVDRQTMRGMPAPPRSAGDLVGLLAGQAADGGIDTSSPQVDR
jgi:diguanylate cyclase (GGDEF)-like protein